MRIPVQECDTPGRGQSQGIAIKVVLVTLCGVLRELTGADVCTRELNPHVRTIRSLMAGVNNRRVEG